MSDPRIHELLTEIGQRVNVMAAQSALSDAAIEHLRAIYATAWIESSYDPYNEKSYEAAKTIWPHIKALNDELKFRT